MTIECDRCARDVWCLHWVRMARMCADGVRTHDRDSHNKLRVYLVWSVCGADRKSSWSPFQRANLRPLKPLRRGDTARLRVWREEHISFLG